jgi:hypothetical protein
MKMKKDDLQTIDQIRLLNQNNALKNSNKMAKDNGKFTYLFCQGPYGLTPSARMAGPSLTMKTAPLLNRNMSEYTSQHDQGNSQSWYVS